MKLLLAKGAAVNQARNDGGTPLIISSQNGHREVVKLLLASGADVDKVMHNGGTPLAISRLKGHREVEELLLANRLPSLCEFM